MTRMRIRHDELESCQIFRNNRAISDTNCNVSDFHSLVFTPPTNDPEEPFIPDSPGGPFIPEFDGDTRLEEQNNTENDGIMVFE